MNIEEQIIKILHKHHGDSVACSDIKRLILEVKDQQRQEILDELREMIEGMESGEHDDFDQGFECAKDELLERIYDTK